MGAGSSTTSLRFPHRSAHTGGPDGEGAPIHHVKSSQVKSKRKELKVLALAEKRGAGVERRIVYERVGKNQQRREDLDANLSTFGVCVELLL